MACRMNRLIIVSNRLPFALDSAGDDLWTVTPAVGGLVSAVEPVLRDRGGTWMGWPGIAGTKQVPKALGANIFPAHPVSAVRHFFQAAATTTAPARAAAIRSSRVPDPSRRAQLSAMRATRHAGRESSFSRRNACDPIR